MKSSRIRIGTFGFNCINVLILVQLLGVGIVVNATPIYAQALFPGEMKLEFSGSNFPTFQSEPQPVKVMEAMGAVLVTADSFRLLTNLTDIRLEGCQSTRPDLPDAQIFPEEIADRTGSLNFAVFAEGKSSFTFRTTTGGAEYAISMGDFKPAEAQVTRTDSGEIILSATGVSLNITRDLEQTFVCNAAGDFTIRLAN